jgi:hypothetical protein
MEWSAPIDAYCERLGVGLAAEPLNALSNAAFFAAAIYGLIAARRAHADWPVWLLAALAGLVGAGSLAFHTFANRWSMLADVVPIAIFIYGYFGFALRRLLKLSWLMTATGLLSLLAANTLVAQFAPQGLLNGSIGYVPALVAAITVALILRARQHPAYRHFAAAAVIFALSLVFRTVDRIACATIPIGTHFLWHVLNATVIGLYLEAAARYGTKPSSKKN